MDHASDSNFEQPVYDLPNPDDPEPNYGEIAIASTRSNYGKGVVRASDVAAQPVAWLWKNRIPFGHLTVLDGDPGLGKSTLLLDLAARLTTARPMPHDDAEAPPGSVGVLARPRVSSPRDEPESKNHAPKTQKPNPQTQNLKPNTQNCSTVVLLSAEDAVADTIRPRLEAAQADLARAIVVRYLPSSMGSHLPQFPQDLYVLDAIIDRSAARLVVVDPLVAYLGKGVSAYRDHDVRRALAPLAQLAERTGVSVVAVRHLSKLRTRNPLYRGGGSIGIIGAARSGLLVARDPADPDRRVLAVYKSNLGPPPPALAYRLVQSSNGAATVQWEGPTTHTAADLLDEPTADDPDRESLEEAKLVLQTILANGPVPAIEVRRQASQAALGPYALRRAKLALGVVSRKLGHPHQPDQSWVWVLPNP